MRTRIAHMIMKLESNVHEEGGGQFLYHVGATLTLTQPYFFHIQHSASVGKWRPFADCLLRENISNMRGDES